MYNPMWLFSHLQEISCWWQVLRNKDASRHKHRNGHWTCWNAYMDTMQYPTWDSYITPPHIKLLWWAHPYMKAKTPSNYFTMRDDALNITESLFFNVISLYHYGLKYVRLKWTNAKHAVLTHGEPCICHPQS